jgi:hypothetical protein
MDGVTRNTMHDVAYIMRSRRFWVGSTDWHSCCGWYWVWVWLSEHGVEKWGMMIGNNIRLFVWSHLNIYAATLTNLAGVVMLMIYMGGYMSTNRYFPAAQPGPRNDSPAL